MNLLETYSRVCVLERHHAGEHLPFHAAPVVDKFGNKKVATPRCLHVDPVPRDEEGDRYRIVFEIIDPRYPEAGWHEVGREHDSLEDAREQKRGILALAAEGDPVRNPRIERTSGTWAEVED